MNWGRLDPGAVERAVKLLIRRLHPTAQGVDGAGGDDGQDIRWESPEGLVIFEVKSHTDRLTSSRKRGITRSLAKAATHHPVRWCLILPLDPSPAEVAWFDALRAKFSNIELEWRGRDWLDAQFAAHQDLRRYVEGPDYDLLVRAGETGHERSALTGGVKDVLARHRTLAERVDELSPFWRMDVCATAEGTTITFREKYAGAAHADPITFTPVFQFPPDDPEAQRLHAALRQTIDFGTSAVDIPARFIERVDVEASEQTRKLFRFDDEEIIGDLHLTPVDDANGLPLVARLERLDADGRLLHGVEVTMTHRRYGHLGGSVFGTDASGVLRVEIRFTPDAEEGDPGNSFTLSLAPIAGRIPYAIRPALQLLAGCSAGEMLAFWVGPSSLETAPLTAAAVGEIDIQQLFEFVTALEELQAHNQDVFAIPDDPVAGEVRDLIDLAAALRRDRVRLRSSNLTVTVEPARLPDFLAAVPAEGALLVTHEDFGYEFAGHALAIGPAQLYAPKMHLDRRHELEAIGVNTDSTPATFAPFDGEGIYLSRQDASTGPADHLHPTVPS